MEIGKEELIALLLTFSEFYEGYPSNSKHSEIIKDFINTYYPVFDY